MEPFGTAPAIVVGIDGSRAAQRAARWAIDEAVGRDIPLRLVYAVYDQGNSPSGLAGKTSIAEIAICHAVSAVEAIGKPVKIEVDIIQGNPLSTLVHASRSAALVCVGAVGFDHFGPERVGSTAAALAASAHCPVAIIRGRDGPTSPGDAWIIAEVNKSPDNGIVLQTAMEQARLRGAPLRVVSCWGSAAEHRAGGRRPDHDGSDRVRAQLDRRLTRWRNRYPDLKIDCAAEHGNFLNYLAKNVGQAQLVIVDARDSRHVHELVGPAGSAVLGRANCSVLVANRQHL